MTPKEVEAEITKLIDQIDETDDRDEVLRLSGKASGYITFGVLMKTMTLGSPVAKKLGAAIDAAEQKRLQEIDDEEGPAMPMRG